MSRQAIGGLGAVRPEGVLDDVAGISRQNDSGGLWDNIALRGLQGNENTGRAVLLIGLAANRGFSASRDTADLERPCLRLEFLVARRRRGRRKGAAPRYAAAGWADLR